MAPQDPQPELQRFADSPGPAPGGSGGAGPKPEPKPEQVRLPSEPWPDELAAQIVLNDFLRAQAHRSQNFDTRWDDNERIYHANVPQRFWDGTDVPRSSLGIKLVWKQLWSLMPKVRQAIFASSSDGIWFDVFPLPSTSPEQAHAVRELQAYQLNNAGFSSYFDLAAFSGVQHGTGVLKQFWVRSEQTRLRWQDTLEPAMVEVDGIPVAVGQRRTFRQVKISEPINRPAYSYVPLRDFYIDPSHKLPWIHPPNGIGQGPKFVIQRGVKTLDELLALKAEDPSYRGIPEREELVARARKKLGPSTADADSHKQMAAQEAGTYQSHPVSGTSDPAKYPFEMLEYWSRDRLVAIIDREITARNIPNPFGFIPFYAIIFWPNPDAFYGKSLPEIIGHEQLIQQGIVNARLDELSLNIHGQLVYQEGMVIGKHQLRPRPGGAIGVTGDVNQAVKRLERQEMTGSAFAEVQQSDLRSEQYTGITGLAVQGSPSVPTSSTRTKFGVGVLAGASLSRLEYLVDKVADTALIPLLNHQCELNTRYLDPAQVMEFLGPSLGQHIILDPMAVSAGKYKFEMRAASRMAARAAMQQSLPFILQTIFNPALLAALQGEGIVPNFKAVVRDTLDVLGWRNRTDWFRELSPEERQQRQQSELTPELLKLRKEQMRLKAKGEQLTQQQMVEFGKLIVEKALEQSPGAAAEALAGGLAPAV